MAQVHRFRGILDRAAGTRFDCDGVSLTCGAMPANKLSMIRGSESSTKVHLHISLAVIVAADKQADGVAPRHSCGYPRPGKRGSGLVKCPRAPYSIRSFGLRRGCGLPLQVAGFIKAAAL